jgi:hypothetical protein
MLKASLNNKANNAKNANRMSILKDKESSAVPEEIFF